MPKGKKYQDFILLIVISISLSKYISESIGINDAFVGKNGPFLFWNPPYRWITGKIKNRGKKTKCVTEFTKENIQH